MRLYLASLWQESNTFCPYSTGVDLFEAGYRIRGAKIAEALSGTNTEIGGFLDVLGREDGAKVLLGTAAWATPFGRITRRSYDALAGELLRGLQDCLPVDGVLLALHGSMVCEDLEDCEGDILRRVRELIGREVPLVCSLDYHACVTRQMVGEADLLVGYRTYPHVDYADTGRRAAAALLRLIRNRPALGVDFVKLPLMLPAENSETGSGPMAPTIERLWDLDRDPNVYAASVYSTQPWLDVTEHGVSVVVYSTHGAGARAAREIADYIWDARREFFLQFPDIDDYLGSFEQYAKPGIVVDSGDITSAGALGDSTVILRALLARRERPRSVLTMVDASAVEQAVSVGEGRTATFVLGGLEDYGYNSKVRVDAMVGALTDSAVQVKGESFSGMELIMGRRARLDIDGGISVIVSEKTSLLHDPEILRSIGVSPEQCDLIVQKSHKLFRAAYRDIARSVQILDTPGFSDMNLKRLPFKNVSRPIYPLDDIQRKD